MNYWRSHSTDTASQFSGLFETQFQHGLVFVVQCVVMNNDGDRDFVLSSSCRLHTAQRAIKQTQVTVQKIGKEIEEKLRTTAACTERVSTVTHQQHFSFNQQLIFRSAAVFRQLICLFSVVVSFVLSAYNIEEICRNWGKIMF